MIVKRTGFRFEAGDLVYITAHQVGFGVWIVDGPYTAGKGTDRPFRALRCKPYSDAAKHAAKKHNVKFLELASSWLRLVVITDLEADVLRGRAERREKHALQQG